MAPGAGAGGGGAAPAGGAAGAAGTGATSGKSNPLADAFKSNAACYACLLTMKGMSIEGMFDCGKVNAPCEVGGCDASAKCITAYNAAHPQAKLDTAARCAVNACIDKGPISEEPPSADFLGCMSQKCTSECKVTVSFEPAPSPSDCGP